MRCLIFLFFALSSTANSAPLTPDWSKNAKIPLTGRANPYGWDAATLKEKTRAGLIHALNYPVPITGLLIPARPALKMLEAEPGSLLFTFLKTALSLDSNFENFKGFWSWLGLHDYPNNDSRIPYPNGTRPEYPMGVSLIQRGHATGLTFSCAACHSAELFGKPILGMTNRFPRANLLFMYGKQGFKRLHPGLFAALTNATTDEVSMYSGSRDKITAVETKKPSALGLDTSLSQVALSLARRNKTPWAERNLETEAHPRPDLLDHLVADSKPAVWWNVKYKNRWLSDGSITSGNPIFTNFLWNEIGRGADLPELVTWLENSPNIVEELTTAAFATQAPKWRDYLDGSSIQVNRAKRGEQLFVQNCSHCHGSYVKAWSLSPKNFAKAQAQNTELQIIDTIKVLYANSTPIKDVGTDPGRAQGMTSLADALNPLAFSKRFNIVIEPEVGYVPPPLEGIFARYPYLHNNSVPNLCALMSAPFERPSGYYSGEAIDPYRDYDQDCVGYPVGKKTPEEWKTAKDAELHYYNTNLSGLSNQGHYDGIFTDAFGRERYNEDQKKDLREFLKTL